VKVRACCQWPQREVLIDVKVGMTVADVRKLAGAALGVPEFQDYSLTVARFGKDVVPWSGKRDGDDAELTEGAMVFALAPAHILPRRQFKPKGAAVKEEEQGDDERFKGMTKDNVWKKLGAKGSAGKLALEYFDINSEALMDHKLWTRLPKEAVIKLLKRDTIGAPEIMIFDAVVRWGKAELKRTEQKETPELMRTALGEIVNEIRFLHLTTEDIGSKVATSGVLTQQQILELFTYLAAKDMGLKPGKSIAMFKLKERENAVENFWNPADRYDPRIELTEKNLIVSSPAQYINENIGVRAKQGYSSGRHYWTILVQLYNGGGNGYNTAGICTKTCILQGMSGYPFAGSPDAWVVDLCRLTKIQGTSHGSEAYGSGAKSLKTGDLIGFLLDMDAGTFSVYYNSVLIGEAYNGLKGKGLIYPCIGIGRLHKNIYVTDFKAKVPK